MTQVAQDLRDWTPPDEIAGPPPRRVQYSSRGKLTVMVQCAVTAFGCWAGVNVQRNSWREAATSRRLVEQGAETQATVVRLGQDNEGKRSPCFIVYQFPIHGLLRSGTHSVSCDLLGTALEGQAMRVRYLPSDPAVNELVEAPRPRDLRWIGGLSLALFATVGPWGYYLLRKDRDLLIHGNVAPARITKVLSVSRHWGLRYEFLLPNGEMKRGSGSVADEPWRSVIPVVYLPGSTHRNRPYPFPMFQVAEWKEKK